MDEDFRNIFENLNKLIKKDADHKTNLLVFNSFLKGLQIGIKNKYLDYTILKRFLKLNV